MRDRGDAIDDARSSERPERIERGVRQLDPPYGLDQHEGAHDPDCEPDRHLHRELADDNPEGGVGMRCKLEHPDHQSDPHRVVDARLALEDRAGSAADLALAEHGEHHRRIRRRKRCAEDAGRGPVEAEQVARCDRHHPCGRERSEYAEQGDRHECSPKPLPPHSHAAVEQDRDQSEDGDSLDVTHRQHVAEAREDPAREGGSEEKDGRRRNSKLLAQLVREHGQCEHARTHGNH